MVLVVSMSVVERVLVHWAGHEWRLEDECVDVESIGTLVDILAVVRRRLDGCDWHSSSRLIVSSLEWQPGRFMLHRVGARGVDGRVLVTWAGGVVGCKPMIGAIACRGGDDGLLSLDW